MDTTVDAVEQLLKNQPRTDAEYEAAVDLLLAEAHRILDRIAEDRRACAEMSAEARATLERIKAI